MVVARSEPLPEVVTADLTARASVVTQANHLVTPTSGDDMYRAWGQFEGELVRNTGKRALVVWNFYGRPLATTEIPVLVWSAPQLHSDVGLQTTREGMEAAVAAYLAANDEPDTFAVIWAE